MNKSKLREKVKRDLDIFIADIVENNGEEHFITEGYWFYDDLLNFAEKLVAQNRKAILEEVRSYIDEEKIVLPSEQGGYWVIVDEENLRQKLSLLEGETK